MYIKIRQLFADKKLIVILQNNDNNKLFLKI